MIYLEYTGVRCHCLAPSLCSDSLIRPERETNDINKSREVVALMKSTKHKTAVGTWAGQRAKKGTLGYIGLGFDFKLYRPSSNRLFRNFCFYL